MPFHEVIATVQAADPGTARFVARRLMEVWQYYLPILGVSPQDFDVTTTVQPVPELEDDSIDAFGALLQRGDAVA
jgi:hypothetical protein